VLFGSNPNRVPGKINRWGYGRESSEWQGSSSGPSILLSSTFEGFMRHSDEESLSEVKNRQAEDTFWYDGIQSRVTPDGATAIVHFFSEKKDFDYTQPAGVECGYRRRLKAGPPDRSRQLKKTEFPYPQPFGFLTAVKYLVREVSDRFAKRSPKWAAYRPELSYVYNAKPYEIAISDLEHHREYEPAAGWQVKDVIEAEFRVTNLKTQEKHNFSLWFPTTGPLRNIPLKIVDKPRWWLRVELTLDPASGKQGGTAQTSGVMPECGVTR